MQLTIIAKHEHQHKVVDFANASYQGTSELTIFAKFGKQCLELGLDDVQPTNTECFKKHNFQISEDFFSYIIIENVSGQVYRWTMIANSNHWKVGVFGNGLPPFSFGLRIPFSELPQKAKERFVTDKLNAQ